MTPGEEDEMAGDPRESTGSWLLGAMPDDEAAAFAELLARDDEQARKLRREIAELQPVADLLPMASPQVPPPPALRDSIMAVVASEVQLLRAAGPQADRVRGARRAPRRRGRFLGMRPALAAAAASLVIVAGVLIGILSGGEPEARVLPATAPQGARASLLVRGDRGELELAGMPQAPSGRVYQVWLVTGAGKPRPTRTLFSVPRDGRARVAIQESLAGTDQVLVSSEPPGGSSAPTTSPVIGARLS